jgi:light-regulated signal transduction histidine kinase (bacteriophytochrome)
LSGFARASPGSLVSPVTSLSAPSTAFHSRHSAPAELHYHLRSARVTAVARTSRQTLDRVFDRFRKGSTPTGSGLGLTISRDLVEAHGGTIAMSSTFGRGTVVTITLPLVTAAA